MKVFEKAGGIIRKRSGENVDEKEMCELSHKDLITDLIK